MENAEGDKQIDKYPNETQRTTEINTLIINSFAFRSLHGAIRHADHTLSQTVQLIFIRFISMFSNVILVLVIGDVVPKFVAM